MKLRALEDMRCLGLESISGLGSSLAAERFGINGLHRMFGGAYILTEGQSVFVPPSDHLGAVERECGQRALLHKVQDSDANRHTSHKLDKQAISLCFVSALAQSEQSKTWLEIKTGFEEWFFNW